MLVELIRCCYLRYLFRIVLCLLCGRKNIEADPLAWFRCLSLVLGSWQLADPLACMFNNDLVQGRLPMIGISDRISFITAACFEALREKKGDKYQKGADKASLVGCKTYSVP
jgi:hypothetical protein